MTAIGILGTGRVGTNLANALARAGHQVTLGYRTQADAPGTPETPGAPRYTTQAEAAQSSEIVINATPGASTLTLLSSLRPHLAGKILVDVANATVDGPNGLPADLLYPGSSLAERAQSDLPDTHVVKTLNTMLFTVMTDPGVLGTAPTVFLSGENDAAKLAVKGLLADLDWKDEWIMDLGGIETARATESAILFVPHVISAQGFQPFAVSIAR
jgi:8-hydroxy-5-deazaflavin:NADPH oxidoreductase